MVSLMPKQRSSVIKSIAALSLAASTLLASPQGGAAVVHAEQSVITSTTPAYGIATAPLAKPAWSIPLAKFTQEYATTASTVAIAEEGRVFALVSGGQLAAYDGTSGKLQWKNGTDLKPLLKYDQGVVYGLTKDGSVFAVGANGSHKWTSAIHADKAASINPIGDTVYVTQDLTFYALDRATGKLRWKTTETRGDYEFGMTDVTESDGVVMRSYYVQGALSSSQINAYDKATGKQLWNSFRQQSPLLIKDGLVYSVMDLFMIGDEDSVNKNLHIAVFNLKTGEKKGERVYKWTTTPSYPGEYSFGGAHGSAFLDGNDLYVYQDQGVAKYDFTSYQADGKPVQRWAAPDPRDYQPLYRVHDGKLLYQNTHNYGIRVLKTANGQMVDFPTAIPAVQTDLFGNGLYVAHADGTFDAYAFATFKPTFSLKLASRDFEPTLKSGNMLYVRNDGKLYAIKLPASLTTG